MAQGVPIPINTSIDFSCGVSMHSALIIAPPAPPMPVPAAFSIEGTATHVWIATGTGGERTSRVLDLGLFSVILEGHDVGALLPHLTIPPNNALIPVTILQSKREMKFQSFYNRMQGKQVALAALLPQIPMMGCGDPISMPSTAPLTNWLHHETVGMTFADYVGGVMSCLLGMATDYAMEKVFPDATPDGEKIEFWSQERKELFSAMLGALDGGVSSGIQHLIDESQPVRIPIECKIGSTKLQGEVTFGSADTTHNPSSFTGTIEFSPGEEDGDFTEKLIGAAIGAKGEVSADLTWDAGANSASKNGLVVSAELGRDGLTSGENVRAEAAVRPGRRDAVGRDESLTVSVTETQRGQWSTTSASQRFAPFAPEGERLSTSREVVWQNVPGNVRRSVSVGPSPTSHGQQVTVSSSGRSPLVSGPTRTTTLTSGHDGSVTVAGPDGARTVRPARHPFGRPL